MSVPICNRFHATQDNCGKITTFWGSKSFKVIDIDIPTKLVVSACYGKQHVCAYLQPFSC